MHNPVFAHNLIRLCCRVSEHCHELQTIYSDIEGMNAIDDKRDNNKQRTDADVDQSNDNCDVITKK